MRSLVCIVLFAAACGSSSNNGKDGGGGGADLSASSAGRDMALLSACGHPGDVGNSLGVGRFCTNQGPDCTGNGMATSCSALFNGQTASAMDTYFCSFQCAAAGSTECGENATCLCNASSICACIPTTCAPVGDGGA
jgi:hypothetical protein